MFMYGSDCVDLPANHEEPAPGPAEEAVDWAKRNYPEEAAYVVAEKFDGFLSVPTGGLTGEQVAKLIAALEKRGISAVVYRSAVDFFKAVES